MDDHDACAVCQRHRTKENLPAGAIFEDEHVFIAHFPLLPNEPAHRGHVILEMKRHLTSPLQLSDAEARAVGLWTQKIALALEEILGAVHVYVLRIGDITAHLHFHFVPRYPDTVRSEWGPLLFKSPLGPKANAAEMKIITEKLKIIKLAP